MKLRVLLPLSVLPLLAGSCSNPSHLMVYQHSNLGVNAGVSPATNNFHVRIGLRREFAAVAPKYREAGEAEPEVGNDGQPVMDKHGNPKMKKQDTLDAASSFVAGRMRVRSPWETPEITEFIASGDAAINVAKGNELPHFVTALAKPEPATGQKPGDSSEEDEDGGSNEETGKVKNADG